MSGNLGFLRDCQLMKGNGEGVIISIDRHTIMSVKERQPLRISVTIQLNLTEDSEFFFIFG